jgi:hypothetical protein
VNYSDLKNELAIMPLQWDRNGVSKKRSLIFLLIKKSIKVSCLAFISPKSSG